MATLHLELTTPERIVLKAEYDSVTIPTQAGEITVLPGHIPLVSNLLPGMITVRKGREESYLAVSGGFVEVQGGNKIVLLADTAERAEEMDLAMIEEAHARAAKMLTEERHANDVSAAGALAGLERELARLKVVRKHRSRSIPHLPSAE